MIRDAVLADPDYLAMLDRRSDDEKASDRDRLGVFAHRIARGEGIVFGYRQFEDEGPLVIDEESFEKITVWLAREPAGGARVSLDGAADAVVVYSAGGSAWPHAACSGRVLDGHVSVTQERDRYRVVLDGTLRPAGNRGLHLCGESRLDREFIAEPIEFADLTTWLGKAGDRVYDETYR